MMYCGIKGTRGGCVLKIALLQMEVLANDPAANRQKAERMISEAAASGVDLVQLPETWNLGFFPKEGLRDAAESESGESRQLLARLAQKFGIHIVGGSLITQRNGQVFNTLVCYDRSGQLITQYDKIHGFSPSGEQEYFTGGSRLCTFSVDGIRAGAVICYDLRFPELVRTLALEGIQILFVCAQWPYPRQEHWLILNRARAIENQMYVSSVNACGKYGDLSFCGRSVMVGPFGELLAQAGEREEIVYGEADFEKIAEIRQTINVFRDRRPELYFGGLPYGKSNLSDST